MPRASAPLLLACVLAAGCGDSKVVSVSGRLTYQGKPVPNAFVHFVPASGRPSLGETDADGKFTLVYDPQTKGAERGKHRVFVQHNAAADSARPGAVPGAAPKMSPEMRDLFDKYGGEKSKVEVTIEKRTDDLKLDWD